MHSFPVIANKFVFIFKDFKCGITYFVRVCGLSINVLPLDGSRGLCKAGGLVFLKHS